MLSVRSILCPVDFSEGSQMALRWAVALAARDRHARLTVLSAVDPLLAEAARARLGMDLAKSEVEPSLREFVEKTLPPKASWTPELTLEVRVGEPAEVILEAEPGAHGLIVMGTQGLGGLQKLLLGSTTERVLRQTSTAVLVVPSGGSEVVRLEPAEARIRLGRVLLATDFGDASAAAAEWAVSASREFKVPLLSAHVVQPVHAAPQWRSYAAESAEAQAERARLQLRDWMRHFCGNDPCETIVALGKPAESIASMAEERKAGLIVLGLAAETGRFAPRPGSIAYRVLTLAKVPVLVVPAVLTTTPSAA